MVIKMKTLIKYTLLTFGYLLVALTITLSIVGYSHADSSDDWSERIRQNNLEMQERNLIRSQQNLIDLEYKNAQRQQLLPRQGIYPMPGALLQNGQRVIVYPNPLNNR